MKCSFFGCKEEVTGEDKVHLVNNLMHHFKIKHNSEITPKEALNIINLSTGKHFPAKMTKERFKEILKEAGVSNEKAINSLWEDRPTDIEEFIDEDILRKVANSIKDLLNRGFI